MPPKLEIVRNDPDIRTIAALERLLSLARSGQILAVAYVAIQPGKGYSADILGPLADDRLLALGMCRELEDLVKA